ncbi:hypothetical protein J4232_05005 [Candidatus Woesearchaeota archaeon]|nr:hypothetical protein [Candidatus Woesearchaeota archaeon]
MSRKLKLILVLIVSIILILVLIICNDLRQISIEKFELTDLKAASAESVTIVGDMYINNPSRFSVPIKQIIYNVILEENNITLSSGEIPSFVLEKNTITMISFSHNMKFAPTLELLIKLLTKEKVFVVVTGKAYADVAGIYTHEIAFSQKIDFKEYLRNQMK